MNQEPRSEHLERDHRNGAPLLAVFGPSGSRKSTLLNALARRLPRHNFTGSLLANYCKLTKTVLQRTKLVTQGDVLYPHLTIFRALLRIRKNLTRREKY